MLCWKEQCGTIDILYKCYIRNSLSRTYCACMNITMNKHVSTCFTIKKVELLIFKIVCIACIVYFILKYEILLKHNYPLWVEVVFVVSLKNTKHMALKRL